MSSSIRITGARQNNLKNLDVTIATGSLTVVTGVSGSGKSSLAFDTLYAEGQRRYVETFSPYARQFLDRMDKPQVDRIDGVLPAIAIDQVNPVRNSRSTVGTMTEVNDHLKLLFARAAKLTCWNCGEEVRRDTPASIQASLAARVAALPAALPGEPRLVVAFPVTVPERLGAGEVQGFLAQQGYSRTYGEMAAEKEGHDTRRLYVVQDRFRLASTEAERVMEALETALRLGAGKLMVAALDGEGNEAARWHYSSGLHCADCDIDYADPLPSTFSFNSPLGACPTCRGFGRVIGVDYGLVIPDAGKTLKDGAVKPWQTASNRECQDDMARFAARAGVRLGVPWRELDQAERDWVIHGDPDWRGGHKAWKTQWYGVARFFEWLESRAYKMHVRVLLSKYRSYTPCPACAGSRLKPDALLWRLGDKACADAVLPPPGSPDYNPRTRRFMPVHAKWGEALLYGQDGLSIHDLMQLPIARVARFFAALSLHDPALDDLLADIRARLKFLCDVGLGYLTLDRQSRTLSGGEVQRINLTTALGTALVNTLFVLDEPSIGLHPRDMHRVVQVMHRLRDAGNTLVVVEHDPQVMRAADRVIDIGPGAGERGGQIVFDGPPARLRDAATLTGDYLAGRKRVESPRPLPVAAHTPRLLVEGARAHNLRGVDVAIPLGRLVCVTGVSGSGKSTLVHEVLYRGLLKLQGKPVEAAAGGESHDRILGAELLSEVVMVDQAAIGKTARSNPASYVGAFDAIRKLFAAAPLARERGYTAGTFSFNSGTGRCPTCGGTGFEHVEMQFLSDVYLRCPDCDGKRYRAEVLEVRVEHLGRSASIDEVLAMTVSEALDFFKGLREVQHGLAPLLDVGLEYLRLGQPVPTLSGGEAQRLKLAGHLADAARSGLYAARVAKKGALFLFDEPTTGLHVDDVARLMRAFRKLLAAGHSLLVIEHNLDVVVAADWVIDLGPEGGDAGGELVAQGTPQEVMAVAASHTGAALAAYRREQQADTPAPYTLAELGVAYAAPSLASSPAITIHNAREHNLKNVTVAIPRDTFTVITGVSGSGKSTLAFDILFNEGQRRYLESLNAYARAIVQPAGKPDVDAITGIPPTVAIEQRTSRGGRKSTVATLTEIHHFLRLLYVKLGTQYCPDCNIPVEAQTPEQIVARLLRERAGERVGLLAPLVVARKGYYTDLARWARGLGHTHLRVDGVFIATDPWPRLDRYKEHTLELPVADLVIDAAREAELRDAVATALHHGQGVMSVVWPLENLFAGLAAPLQQQHHSVKRACPTCDLSFPEPDPRLFSYNSKHGWCPTCYGTGLQLAGFDAEQTGEESAWLSSGGAEEHADGGDDEQSCPDCHGQRLNRMALAVRWRERSIADLTMLSVNDAHALFTGLVLRGREAAIARDIVAEIGNRLAFLREVGLGYLTLERAAPTLSGGEAQRIRLAAQLGSNMQGVCYVLDEPTIGLHPRDNRILLDALGKLARHGNTLVVVEHDDDTIRRADHVIDVGPGAGVRGGEIVAQGTVTEIIANPASLTGRYLARPLAHPLQPRRPVDSDTPMLRIHGAHRHNLRGVDAALPLGRLTVVTGVSGSGKSTLARDVLLANLQRAVAGGRQPERQPAWRGCTAITGWQNHIDRVLEVDQSPIGKTPRSCPATYVGFWDAIRRQFADTQTARQRGWTPARFSFNTGEGRCPVCEGQGLRTLEMSFLPDVKVPCDACHGARFNPETLSAILRGKHVGDVLGMDVDTALDYFAAHPKVRQPLQLMQDVGLGYLTLGQPSPTLSGGEAQRIKLVTELAKARITAGVITTGRARSHNRVAPHTLYVLDEPTVGLAMADVEKLISVLHRLVAAGNTVVVIEHNLDLIAEADWLLDLGPEGGGDGGRLVAQGTPESLIAAPARSHTGTALHDFMQRGAASRLEPAPV